MFKEEKKRLKELKNRLFDLLNDEGLMNELKINIIQFIRENDIKDCGEYEQMKDSPLLIERFLDKLELAFNKIKSENEEDEFIFVSVFWNSSILAMGELGFDLKPTFDSALADERVREQIGLIALPQVREILGLDLIE